MVKISALRYIAWEARVSCAVIHLINIEINFVQNKIVNTCVKIYVRMLLFVCIHSFIAELQIRSHFILHWNLELDCTVIAPLPMQ